MDNINFLYNSEIILRRKSFKIKYYIIFMVLFIAILSIFLGFYKYHSYSNFKAVLLKDKNDYHLKILVNTENMNVINNKYLIINNLRYKYKIKNISDEYYLDEFYNKYYEVLIDTKIDSKLVINNNVIDISIELPKETFLKKLLTKIKKGLK